MRTLALALALFAARDVWDPSCVGVGVAAELADQEFVEAREKTPTGPGRRAANFNRKKSKRKSWGSMFGGGEDGGPSKPFVLPKLEIVEVLVGMFVIMGAGVLFLG